MQFMRMIIPLRYSVLGDVGLWDMRYSAAVFLKDEECHIDGQ